MKILFYGQLNEIGTALCSGLSKQNTVAAVSGQKWEYELNCACYLKTEKDPEELLSAFQPELVLFYEPEDDDYEALYRLMSASLTAGVNCLGIIKEASFYRRVPVEEEIDALLCREFSERGLRSFVLECSCLYSDREPPRFVTRLYTEFQKKGKAATAADEDIFCDALHVDDLCSLLETMIETQFSGADLVTHIQSGYPFRLKQFLSCFSAYFPRAALTKGERTPKETTYTPYHSEKWSPEHSFLKQANECFVAAELAGRGHISGKRAQVRSAGASLGVLAVAFAAVELYLHFVPIASDLQFVDLRLLLIVFAGLFYGKRTGIVSASLCSVSNVLQCLRLGVKWYVIFYHIDNWIPIAVYFIAAILIGTYHDEVGETEE